VNHFNPNLGAVGCTPCPPGKDKVIRPRAFNSQRADPPSCDSGSLAPEPGTATCELCQPGYLGDGTQCLPCPEGTFQPNPGSQECVPGPQGECPIPPPPPHAGRVARAAAPAKLRMAQAGYASSQAGAIACLRCDFMRQVSSADSGAVTCVDCSEGTEADAPTNRWLLYATLLG
jgi:hypothetical protein